MRFPLSVALLLLILLSGCYKSVTSPSPGYPSGKAVVGNASGVVWPVTILPIPRVVTRRAGAFRLPGVITVASSDNAARAVSVQLRTDLLKAGIDVAPTDEHAAATIELIHAGDIPDIGGEGYVLEVADSGIRITANTDAGLFYGAMSVEQLLTPHGILAGAIPKLRIVDWPQYSWRGLHLDVSRHFFSVKIVEKYIEVASRFKLNRFHWHLTDDQGWRLDVPQYPRLTQVGGCRKATQIGGFESGETDETPTCGHYSEADIRNVVAFASERHMMLVPEIEGPGHSVEVLAAYSFLACAPGDYATMTLWGSTKYSECPTERTFAFYSDIFRELVRLFPAPYVHIGGDEVPYFSWRSDPTVSSLMRRVGLDSYADVQGYFTRRVQKIAKRYRRTIIGWDEIEKAGVSNDAVVMAWEGVDAGVTAAEHGNAVIMSPNPPLYFDAYQGPPEGEPVAIGGLTTLRDVYNYDPVASIDSAELRSHIIGAQGNLWSEYVPSASHLWYMAYPRALALSELTWSPRYRMDWDSFSKRAGFALARLEPLGVDFRIPEVTFESGDVEVLPIPTRLNVYGVSLARSQHTIKVRLIEVVPAAIIYYSLNGAPSLEYKHPVQLSAGDRITVFADVNGYRPSASATLVVN